MAAIRRSLESGGKIVLEKLKRLKEPSTWSGLSVLLMLAGINITGDQVNAIIQVGTALAAAAAVFLPERGEKRA